MKPLVIWLIRHKFLWLLKIVAYIGYPRYLLFYCDCAWVDMQSDIRAIEAYSKGENCDP